MFATATGNALCPSIVLHRHEDIALVDMVAVTRSNTQSATLHYLELDTQGVSSPANIGCTVISGHSYVVTAHAIMSASIVLHRQEDIALVDMVAEQRAPILNQLPCTTSNLTQGVSSPANIGCTVISGHSCVVTARKALESAKVFCTARKTLHWWTWLLDTARSNTQSATSLPRT